MWPGRMKVAGGDPPFFNAQFKICHFVEKPIPPFSKPVKLGKDREALEIEVMEEIVEKHYYSIIMQVNEVLKRTKEKYERSDKRDK